MSNSSRMIANNLRLYFKYPFLIPRNRWTGKICWSLFGRTSELDDMPEGWRMAFGMQMMDELLDACKKDKISPRKIVISQVKEKFGELRFYCTGGEHVQKVVRKYEEISRFICIDCGEIATKETTGWISPFCDNCVDEKAEPITEKCSYDLERYCVHHNPQWYEIRDAKRNIKEDRRKELIQGLEDYEKRYCR